MLKQLLTFLYPNYSIQTVAQFYHRLDEFSQCLRAKGCLELAEQIEIAFAKGATGSETVGEVGLALHKIMPKIPTELVSKAKELRHFIRWYQVIIQRE